MNDDNARKFVLSDIDPDFLTTHGAISYLLTTDWLKVGGGNEVKVVSKKYENGEVELLLIEKIRKEDGRTSVPPKKKLTPEEYESLRESSVLHVEKVRYEFSYPQDDVAEDEGRFIVKYDAFVNSTLRILEVDAESDEKRMLFDKDVFPYSLTEVTGEMEYYGYRIAGVLESAHNR